MGGNFLKICDRKHQGLVKPLQIERADGVLVRISRNILSLALTID
jgi:hypothetical protein